MSIYTAGDRTPYTYVITHLLTGRRYYGSRYCKGCKPEDLWVKYFTSSTNIQNLIQADGIDAFSVKVRKTFSNVPECRDWESRVLRRLNASKSPRWINAHNGGSKFYNISPASLATKQRMSQKRKGKPKSNSMKENAMWYYELKFIDGPIEYVKGKMNVLCRLGRKDWETIRICIQKNNGVVPRSKVIVTRMPRSFRPD